MPSPVKPYPLRIEKAIKKKIEYIADKNARSMNKEIRYVLIRYIEQYERKHGPIEID